MRYLAFEAKLPFIMGEPSEDGSAMTEEDIHHLTHNELRTQGLDYLIDEIEVLEEDEFMTEEGFVNLDGFELAKDIIPHNYIYYNFKVYVDNFGFAMELKTRFELIIDK